MYDYLESSINIVKNTNGSVAGYADPKLEMIFAFKKPVLDHIVQSGQIDRIIHILSNFWFIDAIKRRDTHIEHESEGYNIELFFEINTVIKIFSYVISNLDLDLQINQRIFKLFIHQINLHSFYLLSDTCKEEGFACAPLLVFFSLFLNKYINLAYEYKCAAEDKRLEFRECIEGLIHDLSSEVTNDELSLAIENMTKISAKIIGFVDEVLSQKWFNYGELLYITSKLINGSSFYSMKAQLINLLQIALILSNDSNLTLNLIVENYSLDGAIYGIYKNVETNDELKPDISKHINNLTKFLFLIKTIYTSDQISFWNLVIQNTRYKDINRGYQTITQESYEKVDLEIKKRTEQNSKSIAIHTLMRFDNTAMKNISDSMPRIYTLIEEDLKKYSKFTTNLDNDRMYSLNPEYLNWIDLMYFDNPTHYHETVKIYDEFYKSKDKSSVSEKIENSTFNWSNRPQKGYLESIQISDHLIDFLIELIKSKPNWELINEEVEEFAIYILCWLGYNEHQNNRSTIIKSKLLQNCDFFDSFCKITTSEIFKCVYSLIIAEGSSQCHFVSCLKFLIMSRRKTKQKVWQRKEKQKSPRKNLQ